MLKMREHKKNPDFLHHKHSAVYLYGREVVFGMQDGMVSTLGTLTGIAAGSQDRFIILLSGISVITAASLSMAIGTYNSLLTEKKIERRILDEERTEIENSPMEEKAEAEMMFIKDGWPKELAQEMSAAAAKDDSLMLREMAYRELSITPEQIFEPKKKAAIMFVSWAFGGIVPLLPYVFLPVSLGMLVSVLLTLSGLFLLGASMSRFTKQGAFFAGVEFAFLGGMAIIVGYFSGRFLDLAINH